MQNILYLAPNTTTKLVKYYKQATNFHSSKHINVGFLLTHKNFDKIRNNNLTIFQSFL